MSTVLEMKAPLVDVRATCREVRQRSGQGGAGRATPVGSATYGAIIAGLILSLAGLLGVVGALPPGQVWLLGGVGLVTLACSAVLFVMGLDALHSNVDSRKLGIVERILNELEDDIHPLEPVRLRLDFRPDWVELHAKRDGNFDTFGNHWLRIGYTRRNGAVVVVAVTAHSKRTAAGTVGPDAAVVRQSVYERIMIAMVLPAYDLFGAAPIPPIEVDTERGLTLHKLDVQSNGVVFWFDTLEAKSLGRHGAWQHTCTPTPLEGDVIVRQVRVCTASVAGLRTFSRPDQDLTHAAPPDARPARPSIGDRLAQLRTWCQERWYIWRTSVDERQAAVVRAVAEKIAAELEDDAHVVDSGLCSADINWLTASAALNTFERLGAPAITQSGGYCHRGEDRAVFTPIIAERLRVIYERLPPAVERDIPTLYWKLGAWRFPAELDVRCVPASDRSGSWIGVQGQSVRRVGEAVEHLMQVPDNFDVARCAGVAYDPGRDVLALWQRGWARSRSRTFFHDPRTSTWQEHLHEYRSEDEHAAVSFLFDHKRDAFVRIGVTYNAVWTPDQQYSEAPAGSVQLALGEDGRVAVSDAKTRQTLVVDVEHDRIYRVAPAGWSLVARLVRPADFEPHHAVWSLRAGAVRYSEVLGRLICSEGRGADDDYYSVDLGPAIAVAAHLDTVE